MSFFRVFFVVVIITLCGGVFGAIMGGSAGVVWPTSTAVFLGMRKIPVFEDPFYVKVSHYDPKAPVATPPPTRVTHRREFMISPRDQVKVVPYGIALGATAGLILGAVCGISLTVLDRIKLLIRRRMPSVAIPSCPTGGTIGPTL